MQPQCLTDSRVRRVRRERAKPSVKLVIPLFKPHKIHPLFNMLIWKFLRARTQIIQPYYLT